MNLKLEYWILNIIITTCLSSDDFCASAPSFMTEFPQKPCHKPKLCGLHSRIVGGQKANSMIPWQVSLRFDCSHHSACPKSGRWHYCGGMILDEITILTAAHCEPRVGEFVLAGKLNNRSGLPLTFVNFIQKL